RKAASASAPNPPAALIATASLRGSARAKNLISQSPATSTKAPSINCDMSTRPRPRLSDLGQQLLRAAVAPRGQIRQRLDPAGSIDGRSAQQLAELVSRSEIEAAIGTARQ